MDYDNAPVIIWLLWGVLALLPLGQILRLAGEGELGMPQAVAIVGACLIVGVILVALYGGAGAWMLLGGMLFFGNVLPWLGKKYSAKLHAQLDDDKVAKYRAALERDSRNSGALALLAEEFAKKQRYTEAIAHYEAALTLSPDTETNPQFQKWTRQLKYAREGLAAQVGQKPRRVRT